MALTSVKTLNSDCYSAPMLEKCRGELCKDKFIWRVSVCIKV